jgi:hypothetical protein
MRSLLILAFFLFNFSSHAQEYRQVKLETIPVNVEVISTLERTNNMAILKVLKIDSTNQYHLKRGDEFLAKFYFTTKALKGHKHMRGFSAGDYLSLRLNGQKEARSGTWQYTAFNYVIVPEKKMQAQLEAAP